jgi:hypothetical protein
MSTGERQAGYVTPPRRGEVFVVATSTSTAWLDLRTSVTPVAPSGAAVVKNALTARYINVQADGAALYVAVSNDNSTALDSTATGSPGTATCVLVADGQTLSFIADGPASSFRYLAFKTATGSGVVRVWASSPQ